ncbi:MAG: histidine triad nucleotide-binding protein [Candidatus Gastranaerophilales bacterium]|nr:histidine triad nucleotide-binding protein [Candidatus Gastranaerophilales bacterium]
MSKDCIFCKIANKEIPCDFIYENENVVAFNDLNPQAPTHFLVIPKKHFASLNETNDDKILSEVLNGVKETVKKLGINEYRTVINTGEKAGQTVFHLHAHVLADRDLKWPPG